MDPITIMLILAVVGSLAGAGAGVASAKMNADSQAVTNQQNIEMQKEVNAQNQYNIEHAHQIEMNDLKEAGLNPVLTAYGGSGAPIQSLNSPKAIAPQYDLSGISSAMNGLTHMATMAMMMGYRQDMAAERNATLSAIAKGHDAQSAANAALRASTVASRGSAAVRTAKQISDLDYGPEMMKSLAKRFGVSEKQLREIAHYKWVNK